MEDLWGFRGQRGSIKNKPARWHCDGGWWASFVLLKPRLLHCWLKVRVEACSLFIMETCLCREMGLAKTRGRICPRGETSPKAPLSTSNLGGAGGERERRTERKEKRN